MKRRGFLSALAFIAPAAISVAPAKQSDDLQYRGFEIKWRDWTSDTYLNRVIGVWLATGRDAAISCMAGGSPMWGRAFYADYPDLTIHSTPKELEAAKLKALADLKDFIDKDSI